MDQSGKEQGMMALALGADIAHQTLEAHGLRNAITLRPSGSVVVGLPPVGPGHKWHPQGESALFQISPDIAQISLSLAGRLAALQVRASEFCRAIYRAVVPGKLIGGAFMLSGYGAAFQGRSVYLFQVAPY